MSDRLASACDAFSELVLDVEAGLEWFTEELTTGAGNITTAAVAGIYSADEVAVVVELTLCVASADHLIAESVLQLKAMKAVEWFAGREVPGLGVLIGISSPDLAPGAVLLDQDTLWLSSVTCRALLTFRRDT